MSQQAVGLHSEGHLRVAVGKYHAGRAQLGSCGSQARGCGLATGPHSALSSLFIRLLDNAPTRGPHFHAEQGRRQGAVGKLRVWVAVETLQGSAEHPCTGAPGCWIWR